MTGEDRNYTYNYNSSQSSLLLGLLLLWISGRPLVHSRSLRSLSVRVVHVGLVGVVLTVGRSRHHWLLWVRVPPSLGHLSMLRGHLTSINWLGITTRIWVTIGHLNIDQFLSHLVNVFFGVISVEAEKF